MKTILAFFLFFASVSANAQDLLIDRSEHPGAYPAEREDDDDSSRTSGTHVYNVSAWGSIGITAAGTLASIATLSTISGKPDITNQEFDMLQSPSNRGAINAFDRLSLHLSMPTVD